MPLITIADIPTVVEDTLRNILQGIKAAGSNFEHPEYVDFSMQVASSINGIERTQEQDAVTVTTEQQQLTDDVTEHGRTNAEDRINSGGVSQTETSTQEDSAG